MDLSKITLWITPPVWARILACRDQEKTEVGFMGIADDPNNLLRITRLYMPEQFCSSAYVEMEEDDISKHMLELFQQENIQPCQCARVWIHTHPGNSAEPSGRDETTFDEFCQGDFAVMMIVAMDNSIYARLRFRTPFGVIDQKIAVSIDWKGEFEATDLKEWKDIARVNCRTKTWTSSHHRSSYLPPHDGNGTYNRENGRWVEGRWMLWEEEEEETGGFVNNEEQHSSVKAKKRNDRSSGSDEDDLTEEEAALILDNETETWRRFEALDKRFASKAETVINAYERETIKAAENKGQGPHPKLIRLYELYTRAKDIYQMRWSELSDLFKEANAIDEDILFSYVDAYMDYCIEQEKAWNAQLEADAKKEEERQDKQDKEFQDFTEQDRKEIEEAVSSGGIAV